ncbi:MAG: helix-turn-helix domain-containing protein [bacterium]|nr:helix-turn-helix domain-containing protein [bacterium]
MTRQEAAGARADEAQSGAEEAPEELFGTWLRRQREARGVRLREIADASKISLRYLQAFEQGRFEVLPPTVFAKGFLRQYAEHVGLDSDEVLNSFQEACDDHRAEEEPAPPPSAGPPIANRSHVVTVVLAVIAVLIALVWWLSHLRDDPLRDPAAGSAIADASSSPPSASEMPEGEEHSGGPAADRAPSAEPPVPLAVTLDFTGDCWVEAAIDGEMQIEELKVQGESVRLEAQGVVWLKLGNSSVVEAEVNGYPYRLTTGPNTTVWDDEIDLGTARALAEEES